MRKSFKFSCLKEAKYWFKYSVASNAVHFANVFDLNENEFRTLRWKHSEQSQLRSNSKVFNLNFLLIFVKWKLEKAQLW